jgi:hypothetical protein
MRARTICVVLCLSACFAATVLGDEPAAGIPITYTLPSDGPLPRTYRVTLAITEAGNPTGS